MYEKIRKEFQFTKMLCKVGANTSETYKNKWMAASLNLLNPNEEDGDSLLDRIITGDETWV